MDIRIGIIGPGNIANRFTNSIAECTGIKLCAVASRDIEKSKKFAEKYSVEKAYGSYDKLYADKDIDAVYISTLHSVHYEQIIASLNAGKAVLCEKPSLLTVKEAEEVIALAKEKNLLFMEAMWTRFLPAVIQAKKWVDDGKIGDLKLISVSFGCSPKPDPHSRLFDPEKAGGVLYDMGVYPLAFVQYIANSAMVDYKTMITKAFTGVDETHLGMIRFENHVLGQISSSISTSTNDTAYIHGKNGTISIEKFWCASKSTLRTEDGKEEVFETENFDFNKAFKYEIQHFANLMHKGKTESPVVTFDYILNCVKFFEHSLKELSEITNL